MLSNRLFASVRIQNNAVQELIFINYTIAFVFKIWGVLTWRGQSEVNGEEAQTFICL